MGMFSMDTGSGPSQTTSTVNTTASGTGKNIRGVNSNYTESGAIGVGTNAKYQEQGSIDASKGGKVKILSGKAKDQSKNKGVINEAGSTNLAGNQGTIQIGDNGAAVKAVPGVILAIIMIRAGVDERQFGQSTQIKDWKIF